MRENHFEAVAVVKFVLFGRAIVVAENLLVNVAEKVKWFDAYVGSLESAFEKRPEILQSVCVDLPINVSHRMVNNLVLESFVVESLIGHEIVGINRTALLHGAEHFWLQVMFAPSLNDGCTYFFGLAVKNADNGNLAANSGASDKTATANGIHEACRTADEGFVYFYLVAPTAKLHQGLFLHGKPDTVKHEPCGLLGDAKIAGDLIGTDTVLAVGNHPHRDKPLVQRDRRILKDSPDLHAELPMMVDGLALPLVLIGKEYNVFASTGGAFDAIRPANRDHVGEAVSGFGEELNGFLECFRCSHDGESLQN